MTQEGMKATEYVAKTQCNKKPMKPLVMFTIIAIAVVLGYLAGIYNYEIQAAIGPIFGYKSHSGSIDLSSLQQTYNKLAANFDGKIDTKALIEGANRGMVAAADDDYTVYMSPSETTEYNNSLSGNIGGGIGAVISVKNSQITIMSVLDNNPAKSAGLQANDSILAINDQSTSNWSVDKAVGMVRGDEGTTVKLKIQRDGVVKDYNVTRAIINNPSVISSITDGVGTIAISRFDEETGNLAKIAAQNFKKQGVKSIILDLRDNPGGYVNSAVEVASLWLNDKVVVTERSGDKVRDTLKSDSDAILSGISTVVLVNGNSASASEIVAGALQDHGAAKLVGEKTYGKGSVQKLITLDNGGQIKVTIAKWYTPDGKNITKEGIKPNVTATITQADVDKGVDPQIDAAKKLLGL